MTQKEALDILKLGYNVYLTGSAGSGKTHLLNQYIKYLKEHNVDVGITASTGIAATHMNGVTIHSWSGLGIRDSLSDYDIDAMEQKPHLWKRFENVKVLIIDEVSMLHHFRLDLVDQILRAFKRKDEPFGGIQVVLCGDFFQLPPVSRPGEPQSYFIYKSEAWRSMGLKVCYLHEQFRQTDDACLEILNAIRENNVSEKIREHLQSRFHKDPQHKARPTRLFTHNIDVDRINGEELGKITGKTYTYTMSSHGSPYLVETLKKSCLAPESLVLKRGANVMFVKNNYEAGYVNGTLGTVVEFASLGPVVETIHGKRITASPVDWMIEEDGKVKAEISQVPLRLAWAITVHKSQGMSLDAIEVDLSKAFERGMGYVALSRVRTLDGLKLLGLNQTALEVHEEVFEFDGVLKERSDKVSKELLIWEVSDVKTRQKDFIEAVAPKGKKKEKKSSTYELTKEYILEERPIADIAKKRNMTEATIMSHIEELKKSDVLLDIDYLRPSHERQLRMQMAFDKTKEKHGDKLAPVHKLLNDKGQKFSYEEIRIGRMFLDKDGS